MYLMRKFELSWDVAFDIVKMRREIIDPNEGFVKALQNYEGKQYRLKRTMTLREGEEEIDEREEYSGYSQSEKSDTSSSSSEDLMSKRRNSINL